MRSISELGRSACVTTALALSIFLFSPNLAQVNAQGPGQAGSAGAGPGGGGPGGPGGRGLGGGAPPAPVDLEGKTAGEVYKSVKVLKDIPADELLPTMVFITQALGVRCDHCHVPMHFDSDDKKEKDKARDMMKMMAAINTENFKGERVVTCNTCHNGATPPAGIPLLPGQAPAGMQLLAAPAGAPGGGGRGPGQGGGPGGAPGGGPQGGGGRGPGAAAGPPPFVGPAPGEILSKYTQALGGADAIKKVTSRVQSGMVDMVMQGAPGSTATAASCNRGLLDGLRKSISGGPHAEGGQRSRI